MPSKETQLAGDHRSLFLPGRHSAGGSQGLAWPPTGEDSPCPYGFFPGTSPWVCGPHSCDLKLKDSLTSGFSNAKLPLLNSGRHRRREPEVKRQGRNPGLSPCTLLQRLAGHLKPSSDEQPPPDPSWPRPWKHTQVSPPHGSRHLDIVPCVGVGLASSPMDCSVRGMFQTGDGRISNDS